MNSDADTVSYFRQGQEVHFFFEFEALENLEVAAGGLQLTHESGVVAYAKSAFQQPIQCPLSVPAGSIIRFHHAVELNLEPAHYAVTFGLASATRQDYAKFQQGLTHERLRFEECSRVPNALQIRIDWPASGNLTHFGLANLPDGTQIECIAPAAPGPRTAKLAPVTPGAPTILHITHWKAGSQWIRKILDECAPGKTIKPEVEEAQVRYYPIQRGMVYPTVYLTRQELDNVRLPAGTRKFVVIRDLRDTLVSAYFSFKFSHPILTRDNQQVREALAPLNAEAGMIFLLDRFLASCANIQLSWLESDELVLRYEDLLQSDVDILTNALIDRCGLHIEPEHLRATIVANRFENIAGRPRGQEDRSAHERKGVAGDWRNHFTPRVTKAFKARFGGLLVATGYEKNLDW